MKIFVIHLQQNLEREVFMREQLERLGLEFEFFPAVDGRKLTSEEKENFYDSRWARRNEGRAFTDNEIGCALSHIGVYRRIRDEKIAAALILEDDCWLTPSVVPFLKELEKRPPWNFFDVLLLSGAGTVSRTLWQAGTYFVRPMTGGFFAHAYLVSFSGAEKMSERLFPVRHLADAWGWMIRHKVARFASVDPIFALQNQLVFGSSTSEKRSVISNHFSYSWWRYKLYRAFWKIVGRFYSK